MNGWKNKEPLPVVYNENIPPEFFDFTHFDLAAVRGGSNIYPLEIEEVLGQLLAAELPEQRVQSELELASESDVTAIGCDSLGPQPKN